MVPPAISVIHCHLRWQDGSLWHWPRSDTMFPHRRWIEFEIMKLSDIIINLPEWREGAGEVMSVFGCCLHTLGPCLCLPQEAEGFRALVNIDHLSLHPLFHSISPDVNRQHVAQLTFTLLCLMHIISYEVQFILSQHRLFAVMGSGSKVNLILRCMFVSQHIQQMISNCNNAAVLVSLKKCSIWLWFMPCVALSRYRNAMKSSNRHICIDNDSTCLFTKVKKSSKGIKYHFLVLYCLACESLEEINRHLDHVWPPTSPPPTHTHPLWPPFSWPELTGNMFRPLITIREDSQEYFGSQNHCLFYFHLAWTEDKRGLEQTQPTAAPQMVEGHIPLVPTSTEGGLAQKEKKLFRIM